MTEVLHSSTSSPSSSSSSSLSCAPSSPTPTTHNDALFQTRSFVEEEEEEEGEEVKEERDKDRDQLSLLALLVTLFRKSFWMACKTDRDQELCGMEIGWPTNVRHVAHVTFDRFNGFLGLPVEFEPEVPRRAPSASTTVFGVSTESMQLSYDLRGNSVPTILLLMQRRLYAQGGLQAEGIFRINAENSQEEYVRDQLNRGVVPEDIDVHCLAGLIKAWFRELPTGILDSLSPEQVMQCQSEDDCSTLVRLLPSTEAALLDWAINLMADVVQQENFNKMNARNIAMVFAPNMTQMADPLTALMYAVEVMNFLKTLIVKTLRDREDSLVEPPPISPPEPSDESGHHSPSQPHVEDTTQDNEESEASFIAEEPFSESVSDFSDSVETFTDIAETDEINGSKTWAHESFQKGKIGESSDSSIDKDPIKIRCQEPIVTVVGSVEKSKGISNLSRINSRIERIEAWR